MKRTFCFSRLIVPKRSRLLIPAALTSSFIIAGCISGVAQNSSPSQKRSSSQSRIKDTAQLDPVEVRAIRANEKAPFTRSNLTKEQISKENLGQDIPFLLNQTPSVVVNSDAGTGIGYTGMRIRGTDATRINVTVNGIPYNDAESHGAFFVDLPDLASSVNSIQIQRGVGTSSNGTGAFGATVSISTNELNTKPYAEINNTYGSFNTWKNTVKAGTGLINDHFTIDARLSRVSSDGYIDRATSNLQSFYLSGAYLAGNSTLRFNVLSGKEKTYQAWNGVPQDSLATHRTYNSSGTERPGEPYKNETDNYTQTHYQLFFDHTINSNWTFNTALFLTRGIGYYENYKKGQSFSKYGLSNLFINGDSVKKTNLVQQKWLDNYFYGQILSLQYTKEKHALTFGGGWNVYDGKHYGDVIWAKYAFDDHFRYYNNNALKSDINAYAKWQYQFAAYWSLFTDLQYRHVQHKMNGFDKNPTLIIDRKFDFLNPKIGIAFNRDNWKAYLSYAMVSKEPNRDDFEASLTSQPKKETLHDLEAGIEKRSAKYQVAATFYYMRYKDQLVLTGMINDVGANTRVNVPNSYRTGIELQGGYVFTNWLNAIANLTLSRNKIKTFTEFLDEYDAQGDWIDQKEAVHNNTDIAFAPSVVGAATVTVLPVKNFEIDLISKYVGKQYLDNTQNNTRKLTPFYTQDARMIVSVANKVFSSWNIIAQVNNIFNKKYSPGGYTYSYVNDGTITADNYYFPMAGTNFMIGLNVKI